MPIQRLNSCLTRDIRISLHMAEKIYVTKLLHFFDVNRFDNLFIVKKDPGVTMPATNILANEGHVVSTKMSATRISNPPKLLCKPTQHELNPLCDRQSNATGNEQGEFQSRGDLSP